MACAAQAFGALKNEIPTLTVASLVNALPEVGLIAKAIKSDAPSLIKVYWGLWACSSCQGSYVGVSKNMGVPYFGVLTIRILLLRTLF